MNPSVQVLKKGRDRDAPSEPAEPAPAYARGSLPVDAALRTVSSGHTVATLAAAVKGWPLADIRALQAFIASERFGAFLDEALAEVQAAKRRLLDDPRFTVRCQAAFWLVGVHPLQRWD
jgi:hypothetical protein